MKKSNICSSLIILVMLIGLLAGCAAPATPAATPTSAPTTVATGCPNSRTDRIIHCCDRCPGRTVEFSELPQRIVIVGKGTTLLANSRLYVH